MAITFDPKKNARNVAERDLSFELVGALDWDTAQIRLDSRRDYGEIRLRVLAHLGERLHVAVVAPRGGDLRVVSFQKANKREMKQYAKDQ